MGYGPGDNLPMQTVEQRSWVLCWPTGSQGSGGKRQRTGVHHAVFSSQYVK